MHSRASRTAVQTGIQCSSSDKARYLYIVRNWHTSQDESSAPLTPIVFKTPLLFFPMPALCYCIIKRGEILSSGEIHLVLIGCAEKRRFNVHNPVNPLPLITLWRFRQQTQPTRHQSAINTLWLLSDPLNRAKQCRVDKTVSVFLCV